MKISDLLGEGWESSEPDLAAEPPTAPPTSDVGAAQAVVASGPPRTPTEPVEARSSDVIPELASWAPPEPGERDVPRRPVSAREQLADLAAGLAVAPPAPVEVEVEPETDELAGLDAVVDDLLPAAATRRKGSSRGSSRSGSRRRGR
jgi:hypothetical protein